MRNLNESAKTLRELLAQRILVLDGAMGTMLQQRNLNAEDFGGAALEGCNENLVRTRPDVVLDIHVMVQYDHSDIGWIGPMTPDGIHTDYLLRKTT